MFLQPLEVEDEDVTAATLRHLISEGYEGEEPIKQYCFLKKKVVLVREKVEEWSAGVARGLRQGDERPRCIPLFCPSLRCVPYEKASDPFRPLARKDGTKR